MVIRVVEDTMLAVRVRVAESRAAGAIAWHLDHYGIDVLIGHYVPLGMKGDSEQRVLLTITDWEGDFEASLDRITSARAAGSAAWPQSPMCLLFLADDSTVPSFPVGVSQQCVGWVHRGIGPAAIANLACGIVLRQVCARSLFARSQAGLSTPEDAVALYWLARSYELANRGTEASEAYSRCLTRDENLADAHLRLGRIKLTEGDYEAALVHLSRAAELEPSNPLAFQELATVLARVGRVHAARRAQAAAERLTQTNS